MNRSISNSIILRQEGEDRRGSILVPCVFMLSLMSVLTVSILKTGGIGSNTSASLAERSQARMAALSGVEIAYERLIADLNYAGETCHPLGDGAVEIDIDAASLGDAEFEVVSEGIVGQSSYKVRTVAKCGQWTADFPISVGGYFEFLGKCTIMGDCFFQGPEFKGEERSRIAGDLYLTGDREIEYDSHGNPNKITGQDAPQIDGEVHLDTPEVDFPNVSLEGLMDIAKAQGNYYKYKGDDFDVSGWNMEGVIYLEDFPSAYFENCTVQGVLVADDVDILDVRAGYFNIRCDDDGACPNVAILAPDSKLKLDGSSEVDIYGMVYLRETELVACKGVFTGLIVVTEDFRTMSGSEILFQFPSCLTNQIYTQLQWADVSLKEVSYEEL